MKQPAPRRFKAVIFDFDYTLADSSSGVIECVSFALKQLSLPPVTSRAICQTIGLSLSEAFLRLAGPAEAGRCQEFIRLFFKRADEVMAPSTVLYKTASPAIAQLRRHGLRLGIVSNKRRCVIETVLEREGLRQQFEVIIGGEDLVCHKPDPAGLLEAQRRLGYPAEATLYVGDSVVDAEAARRARLPFVGVLSGITSKAGFAEYGVPVVENLSQLSYWVLG